MLFYQVVGGMFMREGGGRVVEGWGRRRIWGEGGGEGVLGVFDWWMF